MQSFVLSVVLINEGVLCRPNIAVARVEVTDGRVVLVNSDRAVSTHRWMSPRDAGEL